MNVSILEYPDFECDNFVRGMPGAKLCHMPAWANMLERTFGHREFYLVTRDGGEICGVLPLTQVRSRFFGNRMISQAFSTYGGPLVKTPAALDILYKRAVELATECGCESIEFRNIEPIPYDLPLCTDNVCMYIPLPPDPDELWKSLRHQIRNRIRKAEKAGIRVDSGGLELLDDFYHVWTIRMHQFGTPCYPRKFFAGIMETFPSKSWIFLARLNDLTVGTLFVHHFNGLAQSRWGATLTEYDRMSPNYLLNWAAMKHYCEVGMKCFDFGRSRIDSSQYTFKKRWGTKLVQLHYQYWMRDGHELSLVRPENPKYRKRIEAWKKMPLFVTRLVGPYISRNLP